MLSLLILVACAALPVCGQWLAPSRGSFDDRTFAFYHEYYGPQAYTNPEAATIFRNKMANGVSLHPPLDYGLTDFVKSRGISLMVDQPARSASELSLSNLAAQQKAIQELATTPGIKQVLWNIMPEWDQSGGQWVPDGRPRYTGLTKAQAYAKFLAYYSSTYPFLASNFGQPPSARAYSLVALTDHSPNTFYAYEMGADLCLLERSIDELGDISSGIAFVRGAARQNNRPWGIDISTFRTSNNLATAFNDREVLLGGWSPGYLKRHYYSAFMSGAHVLRNEAAIYTRNSTDLNPFGRVTKDFADFALSRHPDVGRPTVSTALLLDHYSGFDTKRWIYNQSDSVWYQDIPYTPGDHMINNFFKLAYPGHWLHGQTPGAPFNDLLGRPDPAKFRDYLARGGDPRPYEPMSFTRWGDSLDVITDRASLDALRKYKVIVMLGNVPVDTRLRDALAVWVQEGGTLVASASQQLPFDEKFLGVRLSGSVAAGSSSTWLPDGSSYREALFWYTPISVTTAAVLATGENLQPLVTSNAVGKGRVIFSAPHYLQSAANDGMLSVGVRLLDWLADQQALAVLSGPSIQYIVNESTSRVIVTLVNNSPREWRGSVVVRDSREVQAVREYTADQGAPWTRSPGKVAVAGQVPAYDVRVYAVEFTPRLWGTAGRGAAPARAMNR